MADFIVSPSQIFDVGVLSVKQFGSKYKVIWSKAVRKKGFQPFDDSADDKENDIPQVNTEKLSNNISRAKSLIFEYAFCNSWDYFITLTISPDKFDRYSLNSYVKALGKFINNYNTNYHSKIFYLLIPEQHKDGAWHMHGLISGILPKHLVVNKNGYLDFSLYSKKFGYCSLSPLKSHEAVSKYITKYVTNDLSSMALGQRLYYCSKGLKKSELLYRFNKVESDLLEWDFVHPDGFCKIAMVDNLDFMTDMVFSDLY